MPASDPKAAKQPLTTRHLLVVGAVVAAAMVLTWIVARFFPVQEMAAWLASAGGSRFAPAVYLALYIGFALLALPVAPLSVAAVLIWGWTTGATIELICATIAAVPPFLIARATTRGRMELVTSRFPRAAAALEREGAFAIFLLRLFPLLPYNFLNYLAAIPPISVTRYVLLTATGMLPSLYAFAYMVDAARAGTTDLKSAMPRLLLATGVAALLLVAGRFARRRWAQRLGVE